MRFKFLSELPAIIGISLKGRIHSMKYVLPEFPRVGNTTLYRVESD